MQWKCILAALLKKNKNSDFIVTQPKGALVNRKLITQKAPDRFHEKSGLLCMYPMAGPRYGYNG